ncbi:unnamed protein product [Amaranthus hypochondriacus]
MFFFTLSTLQNTSRHWKKQIDLEEKMMCTIFLNSGSWEAALLAVGTMLSAMRYLLDEYGKIAYALIKPLGHHAQPTLTDRYCILNHAGLAVQLALDSGYGFGYNINMPLPIGSGDHGDEYAMTELVVPVIDLSELNKIVLVAGQDFNAMPYGRQCITMNAYKLSVALPICMHCKGLLLIVLEISTISGLLG